MADQLVETGPMRDPRARIDLPIFDQLDDPIKILRQSVAAGQQRQLAPVHERMAKADF